MVKNIKGKGKIKVIKKQIILMKEVREMKDVKMMGIGGKIYKW